MTIQKTTILLYEKINDIQKIIEISNNENVEIICLDYSSHTQIKEKNLDHTIIDEILTEEDYIEINSTAMNISKNWYKDNKISNLISLDEINFGWLLEFEIYPYLLKKLKIIFTLQKIKKLQLSKKIFASENISNFVEKIIDKPDILKMENKESQKFRQDVFPIKFNIGPIPIMIRINRNLFFKIIRFYEKSFIPIINSISKNNSKKPEILLLDFNPAIYEKLLLELSKNYQVLLYNKRRQAVFNVKSFQAVKKANAKLISSQKLFSNDDEKKYNKEIEELNQKIQKVTKLKEFKENFEINNFSFGELINKEFEQFFQNRILEGVYDLISAKKLFKKFRPNVILHHYGATMQEKIITHEAQKYKINDINFQHGALSEFLQSDIVLKFLGHFGIFTNTQFLAWGEVSKNIAIQNGINEKNILTVGNARYDEYFQKRNPNQRKDTLVFAIGSITELNSQAQKINVVSNYEELLKKICHIMKNYSEYRKIIKIHPNIQSFLSIDPVTIVKRIDPTVIVRTDLDLTEILNSAKVLITMQSTTLILEANLFKVPAIAMLYDPQYDPTLKNVGYAKNFKLDEVSKFTAHLDNLIKNEDVRNVEIKKGDEMLKKILINHGNSSEQISKEIFKIYS